MAILSHKLVEPVKIDALPFPKPVRKELHRQAPSSSSILLLDISQTFTRLMQKGFRWETGRVVATSQNG